MASPFGQTPAFGSTSTSLFGASSSAFGSSATTSLFGASSTSVFGSTTTPSLFGASTPAPAFGAQSSIFGSSTPAFGSSTPAFGSSTPAFGSTTPLFGTSTAPSAFASSAAAFGSTTFGSTLNFGAAPTPFGATTSTPSIFGTPASSPSFLGFGASTGGSFFTSSALVTSAPATAAPTQPQPAPVDTALKELEAIHKAYTPGQPTYRFHHLFLNVVENPQQRVKPPDVDEFKWRQAMKEAGGLDNPNSLWPVQATGMSDLVARATAQETAIQENEKRLEELRALAYKLEVKFKDDLQRRVLALQERHNELAHNLLRICRFVDTLESQYPLAREDTSAVHRSLDLKLQKIEAQLFNSPSGSLKRQLDVLAASARLRRGGPSMKSSAQAIKVDDKSLAELFSVLKMHVEAVQRLQEVLRQDVLNVETIKSTLPS